jgi:tetratricopeptide (TPR) repeat protein
VNKILKYCLFLFLIISFEVKPEGVHFDSLVQTGIKQIYNIKFSEAETTFRRLIADYPDHPAGRFFLAMIDWWWILLDLDSEEYDEIFFQKLEDVIFQCDQLLKKNPENVDALFFKGGAIGFRGRLRAYRESWLKAADDGREALPIVERAANLNPDNLDVLLGFGIYNYYADVIPNEYPLLKPLMLFFPKGDKLKGIEQLNNTAGNGKYAKYEARYFLMTLYYSYENNPFKAFEYAEALTEEFPDNPTFQRWKGRIAAKKGDFVLASKIFQNVLDKGKAGYPGFSYSKTEREAVYYVAFQHYNQGQLDSAYYYFKQCEEISRKVDAKGESGFLINAVLYLGMINDRIGNREDAVDNYRKVLKMKEYGSSHKLAKSYLETPLAPAGN